MTNYVKKSDSRLMRIVGWLLKPVNSSFMTDYWTTIGNTVYYPTTVKDPMDQRYSGSREHEEMHIEQFKKYGLFLMMCGYLFFPLPFLLSGRWFIERYPYLNDLRKGRFHVDAVVDILWGGYAWPYPRSLMKSWFKKKLSIE